MAETRGFWITSHRLLAGIEAEGLMKRERQIEGPQGAWVTMRRAADAEPLRQQLSGAGRRSASDRGRQGGDGQPRLWHGLGPVHLRHAGSAPRAGAAAGGYLGMQEAILFAACFDANGAVFEPLLGPEDAVVSDSLNHASIIDGIRLSKARRYRYANGDMADLEAQLKAARAEGARFVMMATDGVFSMDGYCALWRNPPRLADAYGCAD
jgi:glycine C-acetyltransferase